MSQGLSETAAFSKAESEFLRPFLRERQHSQTLKNSGLSHRVRSFLDEFQSTAEYEGSLKVQRIMEDLPQYLRSTGELAQFDLPPAVHDWERLRATYNLQNPYISDAQVKQRFVEIYEILMDYKDSKANERDGLNGLDWRDEVRVGNEVNRGLLQQSRQIVDMLVQLGVTVGRDGELDYSRVADQALAGRLRENPLVKVLLLTQGSMKQAYPDEFVGTEPEPPLDESVHGLGRPVIWPSGDPFQQVLKDIPKANIETDEQRLGRLKRLWNFQQKTLTDGAEQMQMYQKAVNLTRQIRKRIDQRLMYVGEEPIFEPHKTQYKKEEFLSDINVNRLKVVEYLQKQPKQLIKSGEDKANFENIKRLVKPVEIDEGTIEPFYNESFGSFQHYEDFQEVDEEKETVEEDKGYQEAYDDFTEMTKFREPFESKIKFAVNQEESGTQKTSALKQAILKIGKSARRE